MKAIVQEEYGPPNVLQPKEIDKPAVGDHDVLVRIQAAAVRMARRRPSNSPYARQSIWVTSTSVPSTCF